MGNSLLESANRFMGKSSYEQRELEAEAKLSEIEDEEIVIPSDDEAGDIDGAEVDVDVDMDDAEGGELEEAPLMPVEAAIRAIQMALNGEVETAEEALDLVQDMESEEGEGEESEEGDELEAEEGEEEVEECDRNIDEEDLNDTPDADDEPIDKKNLPKDFKELGENDDNDEDDIVEEEDENVYGEAHSKFLRLSQRYL